MWLPGIPAMTLKPVPGEPIERVVKPPLIEVVAETSPNLKRVPVIGVTVSQVDTLFRSEPLESVLGESCVYPYLVRVLVVTVPGLEFCPIGVHSIFHIQTLEMEVVDHEQNGKFV